MTWFSCAWRKTTISMINVLHILRTTSPANIFGCVFLCSYSGSNMYSSGHDLVRHDLTDLDVAVTCNSLDCHHTVFWFGVDCRWEFWITHRQV